MDMLSNSPFSQLTQSLIWRLFGWLYCHNERGSFWLHLSYMHMMNANTNIWLFLSFASQYDLQGIIGLLYKLLGGAPFIRTKNHVRLQHTLNNPLYTNINILGDSHTIQW